MRAWRSASPTPRGRLKSQLGVGRGDRVAILAANHPDYLVLLYACARLGALLVPLNWRLAVPEQVYILCDASVKALVVEEAFAPAIAPLTKALPDVRIVGLDFRARRRGLAIGIARRRQRRRAQPALSTPPRPCSSSTPPAPPDTPRARCCARRRWCGTR
jgi:acyl-CoA synthetase (AMP-forming)/AMP-acid ligase II